MTPERVAGLVARWVRWYTRDLPPAIAERRIGEIDADLHDHIAHERAQGTEERRIALGIASRMARGIPADASWRSTRKDRSMKSLVRRPFVRVAVLTGLVLLVPLALQPTDGADWGVFDFVFAAALLGGPGLLLEMAARRDSSVAHRVAAAAIGVAAIVFGELDDAPGLVLFGLLLILGSVALTVRTARRGE